MVTRTQRTVTLYVNCLCCSTLRPIAVHIHSVFCVSCTVCGNVQQCAGAAVLRGYCSAVWDAVSLQYTCTEGSVSVHVHWRLSISNVHRQVQNTSAWQNVFCGHIRYFSEKRGKYLTYNCETKMTGREKNKHHGTAWIKDVGWRLWVGDLKVKGFKG